VVQLDEQPPQGCQVLGHESVWCTAA
jgi:hypothetical protein